MGGAAADKGSIDGDAQAYPAAAPDWTLDLRVLCRKQVILSRKRLLAAVIGFGGPDSRVLQQVLPKMHMHARVPAVGAWAM